MKTPIALSAAMLATAICLSAQTVQVPIFEYDPTFPNSPW